MTGDTRVPKTTFACDPCRRRKRKCDRRTPVCSSCEKRNEVCRYTPIIDQRRLAQRDYVATLEARVALLEGILKDAGVRSIISPSGLASSRGDPMQATHTVTVPLPAASNQPEPEPRSKHEPVFVPSDEASQAFLLVTLPAPEETAATTPKELDLGMDDYVPLVSLTMEHKLLVQVWEWQRLHLPVVAPVPLLAAYALYAQAAHPGEPVPPPPPPPPSDLFPGPSAINVPSPESVQATSNLAQFISPLFLDALFSIAALFYGEDEMSKQFYKRAESRMIKEAANPRLATVQGVQLMAMNEIGHCRASAAWALNGVTIALCIRLGMHIDATPLVRCGKMSRTLFETRNFVFWTTYNYDRFYATCLGMHPLINRHTISTPHNSSLATANITGPIKHEHNTPEAGSSSVTNVKSTATTWWSPMTLGMGDVIVHAGWEAIRDLTRLMDALYEGIYSFDAPKRTPQEDLELVARNNLIIQRFLDELPASMRSTDTIQNKSTGIVYLHLFIHLASILTCRPFLSPRPPSEEAMRLDTTTDVSQPTHSSYIIRQYRTLAFRVARASALQIISLVRYTSFSSPCVTIPYLVYSACTILLLVPDDAAAMSSVRMGIACLEKMQEKGPWMISMRDGRERVLALAKRWGVDIGQEKKELRPVLEGRRGGGDGGDAPYGFSTGEGDITKPDYAGLSDMGDDAPKFLGSTSGTRLTSGFGSGTEDDTTQPATSTLKYNEKARSGTTYSHRSPDWTQQYGDDPLAQMYVDKELLEGVEPAPNHGHTVLLHQGNDNAVALDTRYIAAAHDYGAWGQTRDPSSHASGLVYKDASVDGPSYVPRQQSYTSTQSGRFETPTHSDHNNHFIEAHSGLADYERHVQRGERSAPIPQQKTYQQSQYQEQQNRLSSSNQQQTRPQTRFQHQPQQLQAHPPSPHQQVYVHHQYHHTSAPPAALPHVNYNLSHAVPQYDFCVSHAHWHQAPPSTDLNLPHPPHATSCVDLAACFADMVQTAIGEPKFAQSMEDPYAVVAADWLADMRCSFPAMTMDTYVGSGGTYSMGVRMGGSAGTSLNEGASKTYT